jgi:hypothetical protein
MVRAAGGLVDIADIGIDTGWVPVTSASGTTQVSGHEVQVRRIGVQVYLRGRLERSSSSATQTWTAALAAQFCPDRIVEIAQRTASAAPTRVFVNTDGTIASQGTPTSNANMWINDNWIAGDA